MNGREPVYHKYYQVMKVVTFAFKILRFWFSVYGCMYNKN